MENKDLGKCSINMQPNLAALLSYLLGFVTGLIFYLIEKDNKFVRFHAMQSILVFGALFVLHFVTIFVLFTNFVLGHTVALAFEFSHNVSLF